MTRYRTFLFGLAALVITEVALRLVFGLGSPVLSQADPYTGYRFQPNQKVFRFGKRVEYNSYSQRSDPATREKPYGTLRILMLGDSVLNGGNLSDQTKTISEKLETKIRSLRQSVEVLNASAGSWGIGNQLGYLREFGTFQSDAIILLIGTHDLVQKTSTSERVGKDPNYPDHSPASAIQEAMVRYVLPKVTTILNSTPTPTEILLSTKTSTEDNQQFRTNMKLLQELEDLVKLDRIPIYVVFTANREDLLPTTKDPKHKQEFLETLKNLNQPVFDSHRAWSSLPKVVVASYFRDEVHLTETGNEAIASLVFQQFCFRQPSTSCEKR